MYLYDKKLTVGQLMVEVIECSHLSPVQCPAQLFCSLQLGKLLVVVSMVEKAIICKYWHCASRASDPFQYNYD